MESRISKLEQRLGATGEPGPARIVFRIGEDPEDRVQAAFAEGASVVLVLPQKGSGWSESSRAAG